jgi:hypothetical protein
MKRGLVAALSCVAIWLGGITAASADEAVAGYGTAGGFGVGAAVTHRAEPGLSGYYVAAPKIGLQGVVHFDSRSGDLGSASELGLTVNGLYSLISDGAFALPALVGFDFSRSSDDDSGMTESTTGVAFLVGVQPAWWPAPEVSFHLTLGLRIDLAATSDRRTGVGEGTDISIPGTPEFLGSAAVTFWIK